MSTRVGALTTWTVVVCAAAWITSLRLVVQNPRGLWTVSPDPPAHQLWTFTQQQFGDRDVLLVGLTVPADAGTALEPAAVVLDQWIQDQPGVAQVLGVSHVQALRQAVGPFGRHLLAGLRNAVVGRDGRTALVYVVLDAPATPGSLDVKASFIAGLRDAAGALLPPGSDIHLAGQPAIDVALDRLLRDELGSTVPFALVAVGVTLLLLIGWRSLAAVVTVVAGLMVLLAGLALAGVPVSSATAVALPLTVVVGISYAAHVAHAIARAGGSRTAVKEIRGPLAWSYVTTAVALGSFALSPVRALRLLAAASFVGLTVAFVSALSLTPFVWPGRLQGWPRRAVRFLTRAGVRVFRATVRHEKRTIGVWLAAMLVVTIGVLRVRVEPNSYLGLFHRDHAIAHAYRTIDAAFGGSVSLQVLARVDSGVAYRQDRVRTRLGSFFRSVEEQLSIGPVLLPPPARALRGDGNMGSLIAHWFRGRDPRYTRAMFALPIMSTAEARQVIHDLEALADAHSDGEVNLRITGLLPASLPMQRLLVSLMIRSLVLLSMLVVVTLVLASRSLRGGLALVMPNVIAVLAVIAVMGFMGIPIDFTTVSVTSLVLGVAVDDTLQLTWAGRGGRGGREWRASRAVRRTAAPVLLGSLVMVVGAVTLTASAFPPTRRLGGLLAVGLVAALAADLTLTPLLIGGWSGRRQTVTRGNSPTPSDA